MALPQVQTPTFTIIQPSTQKELIIRPFLVKEEKILLVAKESKDNADVYNSIKQVVQNCVLTEGFDSNNVPIYDLEYLFIKLRAVSVNNVVRFTVEDSDDGIEYQLECDLDEVEVLFPQNHTNKIQIDDEYGVILNPPTPAIADKLKDLTNLTDIIYETIKECIDVVYDSEDTYEWATSTEEEQTAFLDGLPLEAYNKISAFFQTTPRIEHVVEYENSNGKTKRVVFRSINDFFMLG